MRVIKVGGNLAEDAGWMSEVARAVAASGIETVLVHGGGKEVSDLQRVLGLEPEWRDGLRVTTPRVMDVVRMVLSGSVNKRWAAALLNAGVDAMGVSGEDAGLLNGRVSHGGALGRTGELTQVRTELVHGWLKMGLTPVISPVSRAPDGGGLNVNADDAAAGIAAALAADELLFVSDVSGVRSGGTAVSALDADEADALLSSGEAAGGMRPKLRAALRAAESVGAVRIGDLEMITDGAAGTRIHHARETAHAGD
ncbi:acetylglutamate kinase [Longimicrobium terrae]|uniref:Acetylglutamate kinase n=1 Tax=Longimicrobium terrae TaxID=1639882 RepID=A0A841H1H1_9BACT|nr:acetylglutamate kinase [Longimicrobium terrae]MBB6071749.1 acetylglutamate kinase [Longimicrobium terrae]NNC28510.1 acetylglutamate kinase [Longimicrobium terrae]